MAGKEFEPLLDSWRARLGFCVIKYKDLCQFDVGCVRESGRWIGACKRSCTMCICQFVRKRDIHTYIYTFKL